MYYKDLYLDICRLECGEGFYEQISGYQCLECYSACVLCNTNSLDCQSCRNFSGNPYFYYKNQCLVTCPNGLWGYVNDNTCELCQP